MGTLVYILARFLFFPVRSVPDRLFWIAQLTPRHFFVIPELLMTLKLYLSGLSFENLKDKMILICGLYGWPMTLLKPGQT